MIKNEVIYKIMKDMATYLLPYQLKKLKSTLQGQLEDVEINLILDKEKIPAIIQNVDDDTAQMIMIDTNIVQRQNLTTMERAKAYKLKEQIKKRKKFDIDKVEENLSDEEKIKLATEESRQTFYRYLSLNNLIPEYQAKCDDESLSVRAGEQLSKLNEQQQRKAIEHTVKKETEFILRKVDNQILEYLKESKRKIMEEQQKLFEKEFNEEKYNKLILNMLSKRMSNLFTNINNDLSNTLNVKKYLNKKTINLSLSKRAKKEFALKHRDVGTIDWEK